MITVKSNMLSEITHHIPCFKDNFGYSLVNDLIHSICSLLINVHMLYVIKYDFGSPHFYIHAQCIDYIYPYLQSRNVSFHVGPENCVHVYQLLLGFPRSLLHFMINMCVCWYFPA